MTFIDYRFLMLLTRVYEMVDDACERELLDIKTQAPAHRAVIDIRCQRVRRSMGQHLRHARARYAMGRQA